MKNPTKTINRLHFSDLDPLRFEDLCLNLVSRLDNWKEINHFGRKGSDAGVDICAIQSKNNVDKVWFIQCKRHADIYKKDITDIVNKVSENDTIPHKLLVIVACDVSRETQEYLKKYSLEKGITETELWTASILEDKLYKDYKDLLFVYFGLRLENRRKDNTAKIKHSLRMEKRVQKELIDHKNLKQYKSIQDFQLLSKEPWRKFISDKVYIRSIDDNTYRNREESKTGQISPWFQTFFYDTYHNGIEFWLDACLGTEVVIDKNNFWEILHYSDSRIENSQYKIIPVRMIGKIPYHHIVDFKANGDEYSSEPHLFCKFDIDGMPYEEVCYRYYNGVFWTNLDEDKKTTFPKE